MSHRPVSDSYGTEEGRLSAAELIRDDAGKPVDFCILEANLAYESILGRKREEAIGRTLFEMFAQLSHDRFEAITAVAQTGEPLRWQGLFEPTERYYENVYYSPRPGQIAGIFTDITERKRAEEALHVSEERFRLALKNSPVNVSTQDLNLRYTWQYNPQLGYEVKNVVGKTDLELLTPETAEHVTLLKRKVLRIISRYGKR